MMKSSTVQNDELNSCFYQGKIRHRRFSPKKHDFSNRLYLLAIDLDEYPAIKKTLPSGAFSINQHALISFKEKDYLRGHSGDLKTAVWQKVSDLGGQALNSRVLFVGQGRCLGIYFSPLNLYYCYDDNNDCRYVLAEVSNTPWNQRHYYLLTLSNSTNENKHFKNQHAKCFHVSPFMEMNVDYHWKLKLPHDYLSVHLENITTAHPRIAKPMSEQTKVNSGAKVFDATLTMKRVCFSKQSLIKLLIQHPSMTASAVLNIYWQALKLWLKKVPYVPKPDSDHVIK